MNRQQMIDQLEQVPEWDIIIVGGGSTGLGAAVDAASRGYKTLLIEQYDFAKGTSSRSTKLIHGGVRYLAQGNIKLVKESLRERGILLKNAPHICHNIPFVLPLFHWWEKWYYSIGLKFYDLLSGKLSLGKTAVLSKKITGEILPAVKQEKLKGSVLYHDGQFDDSRLAIALARTAADQGAAIINYCRLFSINKSGKKISGIIAKDMISGKEYLLKCKVLINATGVFTDSVMQLDDEKHKPILSVSQGIHIVVDKKFFPGNNGLIIPKTDDGRVLFALPWHNKVVIGTTDTALKEILNEPIALKEEIDFVVLHVNRYLNTNIQHNDILSVFAGLRPLISAKGKKSTSFLPRDYITMVSETGMVTITGGKWTTYRTMGKAAVDKAALVAGLQKKECKTGSLQLHGYTNDNNHKKELAIYGSDAAAIEQLIIQRPALKEKLHERFPYIKAEVIWAIQQEMAMTVEDILARRTRALFLDAKAAMEAAPLVALIMSEEMQVPPGWKEQQVKDFTVVAEQYLIH